MLAQAATRRAGSGVAEAWIWLAGTNMEKIQFRAFLEGMSYLGINLFDARLLWTGVDENSECKENNKSYRTHLLDYKYLESLCHH